MIGRVTRNLFGRDAEDELPPADLPSGSSVESLEAALGDVPSRLNLPLPRWLGPLAICCLVGFLPWIVYLGLTLPRRSRAEHYDLAWIGFDGAMWVVMAALGWVALKRHPATGPVAAVASTMLVVDAWFDVTTSSSGGQFVLALVLALCAEIPFAIVCAWAAINAERIRARAHRRLHARWQHAIRLMHQAAADRAVTVSPPPPAPPQR